MDVALLVVAAGVLALLFYVVRVVNPSRVKARVSIWKLAEVNLEADGEKKVV